MRGQLPHEPGSRQGEDNRDRSLALSSHVKITAILTAKPGKAEALLALLKDMLHPSRAEAGNLRYDLWRDQADAGRLVLDELYVDNAAITAHRATPHFADYLSKIGDLAERTALVLDPVDVA
jgi:quinol monooxygenase YgiN